MSSSMWDVKSPEELQDAIQALKREAVGPRYVVATGSDSGHCCFEASVIDNTSPTHSAICECFEVDDAKKIAALLNAAEQAAPVVWEAAVGLGVVVK